MEPMKALPFENLPVAKKRRFVPARVNWSDWNEIAPLYDQLETRAAACRTRPNWSNGCLIGANYRRP